MVGQSRGHGGRSRLPLPPWFTLDWGEVFNEPVLATAVSATVVKVPKTTG